MAEITLPEGLESIGASAFSWSGITSVTIPDSVTAIEDYAFYCCGDLSEVHLGTGLTIIGKYAFYSCGSLTEVCISDRITKIDNSAFECCFGLNKVLLGRSIDCIGTRAFAECEELKEMIFPDGITKIKKEAFCDCSSLKSVRIPCTVTVIGTDAFVRCRQLTITGYSGSAAEDYAISSGIPFISLGETTIFPEDSEKEMPQPSKGPDVPMKSNNQGKQNYTVWSDIVTSYLVENGDGTFTRVEYNNEITVETYDSRYQFMSRITVPMELSIFGGFYSGSDYNFIVFGQENPEEDDDQEVIRVVRYTKDWVRLDSAGLYQKAYKNTPASTGWG